MCEEIGSWDNLPRPTAVCLLILSGLKCRLHTLGTGQSNISTRLDSLLVLTHVASLPQAPGIAQSSAMARTANSHGFRGG